MAADTITGGGTDEWVATHDSQQNSATCHLLQSVCRTLVVCPCAGSFQNILESLLCCEKAAAPRKGCQCPERERERNLLLPSTCMPLKSQTTQQHHPFHKVKQVSQCGFQGLPREQPGEHLGFAKNHSSTRSSWWPRAPIFPLWNPPSGSPQR